VAPLALAAGLGQTFLEADSSKVISTGQIRPRGLQARTRRACARIAELSPGGGGAPQGGAPQFGQRGKPA
jgi:hypothetical protein